MILSKEYTFGDWALTNLPGYTKGMKEHTGNINCSGQEITSLYGCPEVINGYFDCGMNKLTSFKISLRKLYCDIIIKRKGKKMQEDIREYTFEEWALKNLKGYTKGIKEYNGHIDGLS